MSEKLFTKKELESFGKFNREHFKIEFLDLINREILIQRDFMKKQSRNKKSIAWRIIGMKLLMKRIKGMK